MAKSAYIGIKRLPSTYTRLDYIQTDGNQYINTRFVPNSNTRIVMDCEIVSHETHGVYFGTRATTSGTDSVTNTLFILSTGTIRSDFYGSKTVSTTALPSGRHIVDRNKNVTRVGEYTVTSTASSAKSIYPLTLFSVNTHNVVNKGCCIKVYSCKIYDNETLIRDYIPCSFGGKAGMYDHMNHMFYPSEGTSDFIAGNAIAENAVKKISNIYIGLDKEFPIYDTTLADTTITASNISTYFKVTNGSYYFSGSGSTFTSNNKGIDSTTATTTLTALQDYSSLSFNYSYSGESGFDYLNLKVNGVSVATNASGSTTTKTYTGSILAGQTIEFSFRKDGSASSYDDCATWSNMVVSAKTQIGVELKSIAKKIKKIYSGVDDKAVLLWSGKGDLKKYGMAANFTSSRSYYAAATVGNYAVFAGGSTTTVEVYDKNLVHSNPTAMSSSRTYPAGATANNKYALFGGGNGSSNVVDAYSDSLVRSTPTVLSQGRDNLAAASVGVYALFCGGYSGYSTVDAYDGSLTRTTATSLSASGYRLRAASFKGHHALVAGGSNRGTTVDVYDVNLTRTNPTALSYSMVDGEVASNNNYILVAGGGSATVNAYDKNFTRNTNASLSSSRSYLAATSTDNYAIFGGGSSTAVDGFDDNLVRTVPTAFNSSKSYQKATTVKGYAIFGGSDVDVYFEN